MSETSQPQQQNIPSVGPVSNYPQSIQQPTHVYAGQTQQKQFHVPTSSSQVPSVHQMQYFNPNQPQFAANMGYYPMPPPYYAYPAQFVLPS